MPADWGRQRRLLIASRAWETYSCRGLGWCKDCRTHCWNPKSAAAKANWTKSPGRISTVVSASCGRQSALLPVLVGRGEHGDLVEQLGVPSAVFSRQSSLSASWKAAVRAMIALISAVSGASRLGRCSSSEMMAAPPWRAGPRTNSSLVARGGRRCAGRRRRRRRSRRWSRRHIRVRRRAGNAARRMPARICARWRSRSVSSRATISLPSPAIILRLSQRKHPVPPSTWMVWAVMKEASSLSRTRPGRPRRRAGRRCAEVERRGWRPRSRRGRTASTV